MSLKLHEGPEEAVEDAVRPTPAVTWGSGTERIDNQPVAVEMLEYILTLTSELKALARQAGHNRLGLILMLAEEEARQKLGIPR